MADVSVINVTSLTPIVAAAIVSGQQVTIYDNGGIAYRAPIEDVVSAAQDLNGCLCVKRVKVSMTPAQVQTLDTIPVDFAMTVPVGMYAKPIGADLFMDYNSAAYVSLSPIMIYPTGGGAAVLELPVNVIDSAADIAVQFGLKTGAASQIQFISGSGYSITSIGAVTTGDSPIDVYLTYALIEI